MEHEIIKNLVTKSINIKSNSPERIFEGILTVEVIDKDNEITAVKALSKTLLIWMDRGAPITDTHSNVIVGKGLNFMETTLQDGDNTYPAIKIVGKIYNHYKADDIIWEYLTSGKYKGLSWGGSMVSNKKPYIAKDGKYAMLLDDMENYEVAVCEDPVNPLALIVTTTEENGAERTIVCNEVGCSINKAELEEVKKPLNVAGKIVPDFEACEDRARSIGAKDPQAYCGAIQNKQEGNPMKKAGYEIAEQTGHLPSKIQDLGKFKEPKSPIKACKCEYLNSLKSILNELKNSRYI